MKLAFIAKHRAIWPLACLCEAMGLSVGLFMPGNRSPGARSGSDTAASQQVKGARSIAACSAASSSSGAVLGGIDELVAHSWLRRRRKRLVANNSTLFAGAAAAGTNHLILTRTGRIRPRLQRTAHGGPPFNLTQIELAFPRPCALMALSIYVRFGSATCKGASSPCRISFGARRCLALFLLRYFELLAHFSCSE